MSGPSLYSGPEAKRRRRWNWYGEIMGFLFAIGLGGIIVVLITGIIVRLARAMF